MKKSTVYVKDHEIYFELFKTIKKMKCDELKF